MERFVSAAEKGDKNTALLRLGEYMHAQQDSYSHNGYDSYKGHLSALKSVDKTYNNVPKADRMAEDSYYRLAEAAKILSENGLLKYKPAPPLSWKGELASQVHLFNEAGPVRPVPQHRNTSNSNSATNTNGQPTVKTGNDARSAPQGVPVKRYIGYGNYQQRKDQALERIIMLVEQNRGR